MPMTRFHLESANGRPLIFCVIARTHDALHNRSKLRTCDNSDMSMQSHQQKAVVSITISPG